MHHLKTPAEKVYLRRTFISTIFYLVTLWIVTKIFSTQHPQGPLAYLLAALPVIPIIINIIIFGKYLVEERDDFVRMVVVQSSLWATGVVLSISMFMGFLESYGLAPNIHLYWVYILWCLILGISEPLIRRRYA